MHIKYRISTGATLLPQQQPAHLIVPNPAAVMVLQVQMAMQYFVAFAALDPADQERLKSRWGDSGEIIIDLSEMRTPVNNAQPADVFEYMLGNRRETPQRAQFYLASMKLGKVDGAGWNGPRSRANNGIDTLEITKDYHVWCVDVENGDKVMDYPDNQLAPSCTYRTDHVVRQAGSKELDEGIRPRLEREFQFYIQQLINKKGSVENLMAAI